MDCKEAQEDLVSLFSGELSEREKRNLLAHLAACRACSEEKEGLEKIWRDLGALPEIVVPADLREATISRIAETLKEEQPDRPWVQPAWENWIPKPFAAVLAGMAMAVFSMWVVRGVTALEQFSGEVIFLCAALWTGLLAASFLFATGSFPALGLSWQWSSRVGLLSLGLTMLGTLLCPKMNLIHWWETLPPGQFLLSFGPAVSHAAFGVIYSFLPFAIALYLLGRKMKGKLLRHALGAGILYFVLLFPGILLQTLPLSALVFLSWTVGSALGVTIAVLGSAGFFRLTSSVLEARA